MAFFRFKDSKRCRARMEARWPGGVILAFEDQCRLQIGHDSVHIGETTGTRWDTADRHITARDPKAPLIFLPR